MDKMMSPCDTIPGNRCCSTIVLWLSTKGLLSLATEWNTKSICKSCELLVLHSVCWAQCVPACGCFGPLCTLTHLSSSYLIIWNWMWLNFVCFIMGDPWASAGLLFRMMMRFVSSIENKREFPGQHALSHIHAQTDLSSINRNGLLSLFEHHVCAHQSPGSHTCWSWWAAAGQCYWHISQ